MRNCLFSFRRRGTMLMVCLCGVIAVFKRAMGGISVFVLLHSSTHRSFIEMYLLLVRLLLVAVLVALSVVFFGWTLGVLYVILDVLFF